MFRLFHDRRCSRYSSEELCKNHDLCRTDMPKKGENILKFKNYNHQMPAPAMIYADFEAYQKKLDKVKPINQEVS